VTAVATPEGARFHALVILFILLVGVLVRCALFLAVDYSPKPGGDDEAYRAVARELATSGNYAYSDGVRERPYFARPPLYPLFVSVHYRLFGASDAPVQMTQAALGIMLAILVYLGLRGYSQLLAAISALLIVLVPFDALYSGRILSETLTTLLVCSSAIILYRSSSIGGWFWGGILLGLACLTRDVYILLAFAYPVFLFLFQRQSPGKLARFMALLAGVAIIVSPWFARNYLHTTDVFLSRGNLGGVLWMGTWERNGAWAVLAPDGLPNFPDYAFRNEEEKKLIKRIWNPPPEADDAVFAARDKNLLALALQRIRDHPFEVIGTWLVRQPRLWIGTRTDLFELRATRFGRAWYAVKASAFLLNAVIVALAVAGIAMAWRKRDSLLILAVPIIYTLAIYFPLHNTETRYSQPVYPLLLVFVAYVISELTRRRKAGADGRPAPGYS
jgi:4-amino-4-deoxy-L-arabinose transferase-like glycosyltransferase